MLFDHVTEKRICPSTTETEIKGRLCWKLFMVWRQAVVRADTHSKAGDGCDILGTWVPWEELDLFLSLGAFQEDS